MSTHAVNGARAIRLASGAKIAAGTLVLAAVGLAVGVPGLGDQPIAKPQIVAIATPSASAASPGGADPSQIDSPLVIADRLDLGRKKAPAKPVEEAKPAPEIVAPAHGEWKFLGMIREPNRNMALVSIEGAQTVVPEGYVLADEELVAVTPQGITIRKDGVERHVGKTERSASSVAWVKMPTNTPPANIAPNVNANPGPGGPIPADMAARMRDAGIDPAQAQKMREFFRSQRGRGGNGFGPGGNNGTNGRGGNEPFLDGRRGFDPGSGGGQR
jgi:hypothetical protein